LQDPKREETKKLYIKEVLLLRQSLSLCQSLLQREERLKAAYFEAVRTLLTRVEGKGKISLREINERINDCSKSTNIRQKDRKLPSKPL
jgi:type I restriction enzyme R subunit